MIKNADAQVDPNRGLSPEEVEKIASPSARIR